jgi:hypothetical protein
MLINPIKEDPELQAILKQLNSVQRHEFTRWRTSFLARYESFLDKSGTEIATKKYRHYSESVTALMRVIFKVEAFVRQRDLMPDKSTVKARHALSEMSKQITVVIEEQDALLPATGQMEKEIGYGKFIMGAVLVRDSFSDYRRLSMCVDSLENLHLVLTNVANRQIMEEMERFGTKFQTFCDVVSDLGLRGTLEKCHEFVPVVMENPATSTSNPDAVSGDLCPSNNEQVNRALTSEKKTSNDNAAYVDSDECVERATAQSEDDEIAPRLAFPGSHTSRLGEDSDKDTVSEDSKGWSDDSDDSDKDDSVSKNNNKDSSSESDEETDVKKRPEVSSRVLPATVRQGDAASLSFPSPEAPKRYAKKKVVTEPFIDPKDDPAYAPSTFLFGM